MKQGTRVKAVMVTTKTENRAERHNSVIGTLLADVVQDGMLLIFPEKEGDNPKGLATTQIKELNKTDDGVLMVQTRNTLYKVEVLNG
jgi:hypothetical protein